MRLKGAVLSRWKLRALRMSRVCHSCFLGWEGLASVMIWQRVLIAIKTFSTNYGHVTLHIVFLCIRLNAAEGNKGSQKGYREHALHMESPNPKSMVSKGRIGKDPQFKTWRVAATQTPLN